MSLQLNTLLCVQSVQCTLYTRRVGWTEPAKPVLLRTYALPLMAADDLRVSFSRKRTIARTLYITIRIR